MADDPQTEQDEQPAVEQDSELQDEIVEAYAGQELEDVEQSKEDLSRLLEDTRSKADEHWDQLMRAKAELENLHRRQKKELENAHKFGIERFVRELLPIQDSLELGLAAAQDESTDVEKLREGSELTLNLFTAVMNKFEIAEVNPEGEIFNPDLHQAMSMIENTEVEPNTVVTVVQKGYTLNGRLVRPAMVMVSRAAAKPIDEQA